LTDDAELLWDLHRRRCGLAPSYDGGILICPTGSSQATAVDLTSRSLVWRFRLRDRANAYESSPRQLMLRQQQQAQKMRTSGGIDQNRWLDSTAVISDGCVFLTPRDSNELHCLSLFDGATLWKTPRGDGLFLAGIHDGKVLIVGKS